ncbi:hypothetical protein [Dactylosporangium sp. CA-233914]
MSIDEPGHRDGTTPLVNRLEASGSGDVVQARDIHGGIHFHSSDPGSR